LPCALRSFTAFAILPCALKYEELYNSVRVIFCALMKRGNEAPGRCEEDILRSCKVLGYGRGRGARRGSRIGRYNYILRAKVVQV
jgi:hypothetical protein